MLEAKEVTAEMLEFFLSGLQDESIHFLRRGKNDLQQKLSEYYRTNGIREMGYEKFYFGDKEYQINLRTIIDNSEFFLPVLRSRLTLALGNGGLPTQENKQGFIDDCVKRISAEMKKVYRKDCPFSFS